MAVQPPRHAGHRLMSGLLLLVLEVLGREFSHGMSRGRQDPGRWASNHLELPIGMVALSASCGGVCMYV